MRDLRVPRVTWPVLFALLLGGAGVARAQEQRDTRNWVLIPQIAVGELGARWQHDDGSRIAPGAAPTFGLALQHDHGGRLAGELLATFTSTDYAIDDVASSGDVERVRGVGGLQLMRAHATATLRLRANVPGYFSVGAGAIYYRPTDPVFTMGGAAASNDRAQWMPAAHIGLGLDVGGGAHRARIDGRAYISRPREQFLQLGSRSFERRSALDLLIALGYLVRL